MICPKYKAAYLSQPPFTVTPISDIHCDQEDCAWWDGTRKKCSINTDQSKPEEEA